MRTIGLRADYTAETVRATPRRREACCNKTGNAAAVQRQLGHSNVAYSLQYARITDEELQDLLDER